MAPAAVGPTSHCSQRRHLLRLSGRCSVALPIQSRQEQIMQWPPLRLSCEAASANAVYRGRRVLVFWASAIKLDGRDSAALSNWRVSGNTVAKAASLSMQCLYDHSKVEQQCTTNYRASWPRWRQSPLWTTSKALDRLHGDCEERLCLPGQSQVKECRPEASGRPQQSSHRRLEASIQAIRAERSLGCLRGANPIRLVGRSAAADGPLKVTTARDPFPPHIISGIIPGWRHPGR